MKRKQLKLATMLMSPGASSGAWRHPLAQSHPHQPLAYYTELARKAELGKLDYIFQADQYRISATAPHELEQRVNVGLEPMMLLAALSAATSRIGLAATLSTTYSEPYHTARMFATLDHLSGGRAAWNVVTSRGELEADNFKNDHRPSEAERHEQSDTYVEIVKALWDSWEDEAIVYDKATGRFADKDKVHYLHHESRWHSVKGPLNVARPPQGHPVLIQAGASDAFCERAARQADVIFTMAKELPAAQRLYSDVKQRLPRYGRRPEELLVLPGLNLYAGATAAEARDKRDELERLGRVEASLDGIAYWLDLDLADRSLDDPLPEPPSEPGRGIRYRQLKQTADQLGLTTIRQLYMHIRRQQGHLTLTGTPVQIADELERWLREGGADGFTFIPHILPRGLDDLVDLVVPELQHRGIFRIDYEGSTLREHLGLPRPMNRFATR